MKLRHLFGGLMVAACLVGSLSSASATTRVVGRGLDETIDQGGSPSLIIQGTCFSATPTSVSFPNDPTRKLPAILYFFKDALVLKGNSEYQASNAPQEVKIKMYAGQMGDSPRPIPGESATWIFFGPSVLGLTSAVGGNQGYFPETQVNGTTVVETRGLVFYNKSIEQKFLGRNPANSKFLQGVTPGGEPATSQEQVTPAALRDAIQTIVEVKTGGGK